MGLWLCGRVPDLRAAGCRFESWPGLLRTKICSAFRPFGVGKWVPAAAGKARQVWLIAIVDERVDVLLKFRKPAIPVRERYCKLNAATWRFLSIYIWVNELSFISKKFNASGDGRHSEFFLYSKSVITFGVCVAWTVRDNFWQHINCWAAMTKKC